MDSNKFFNVQIHRIFIYSKLLLKDNISLCKTSKIFWNDYKLGIIESSDDVRVSNMGNDERWSSRFRIKTALFHYIFDPIRSKTQFAFIKTTVSDILLQSIENLVFYNQSKPSGWIFQRKEQKVFTFFKRFTNLSKFEIATYTDYYGFRLLIAFYDKIVSLDLYFKKPYAPYESCRFQDWKFPNLKELKLTGIASFWFIVIIENKSAKTIFPKLESLDIELDTSLQKQIYFEKLSTESIDNYDLTLKEFSLRCIPFFMLNHQETMTVISFLDRMEKLSKNSKKIRIKDLSNLHFLSTNHFFSDKNNDIEIECSPDSELISINDDCEVFPFQHITKLSLHNYLPFDTWFTFLSENKFPNLEYLDLTVSFIPLIIHWIPMGCLSLKVLKLCFNFSDTFEIRNYIKGEIDNACKYIKDLPNTLEYLEIKIYSITNEKKRVNFYIDGSFLLHRMVLDKAIKPIKEFAFSSNIIIDENAKNTYVDYYAKKKIYVLFTSL